jgi:PTH1 family peptidyl-tRNA hydrolase
MKMIVGLGNPGKKFDKTRHNVGFRVIDELQKEHDFPDFELAKKFKALISEGFLNNEDIILAKPQTFMNSSGEALKFLIQNYKLKTTNLFVVHDDLDLPLGKIKISVGRSSAGHKGVESIIRKLYTRNFVRFRVGIKPAGRIKSENFVLQKFTKEEEKILKGVVKKTIEAIDFIVKVGTEKAMNRYNQ